jgi:MFS family permease
VRLSRNRDFVLFQAGQLLSAFGSSLSAVAYPLLVLALTHSAAKAGFVGFARLLPSPLLGFVAGIASDRLDRRRIMLSADLVRALALGALAVLVTTRPVFWPIPLIAFVEGAGDVFFAACNTAVLRSIVPAERLPDAVSVWTARSAAVGIVGPPAGGALFGLTRVVPFASDAISYAASFGSLLAIRTPFQEDRPREPLRIRADLAEGFRFLWRQRFLRVTSFLYAVGNITEPAYLLTVIVVGRREGLSSGEIGLLLGVFSASILGGSLLAPLARRRIGVRTIVLSELYLGVAVVAFLVRPSVWVLFAALLPQAVCLPITDSVVVSARIAVTPDRLLGRVETVRALIARGTQALGPLAAGALLASTSERVAVGTFAALTVALAVAGTLVPLDPEG